MQSKANYFNFIAEQITEADEMINWHNRKGAPINNMKKQGQWLQSPACERKIHIWVREDTEFKKFLIYCPKCKQERLINLKQFRITLLQELDA